MAHLMMTVCVIGSTGAGKSSLCNLLSGDPHAFHVDEGIDACTQKTVTKIHSWLGHGDPFVLIDTPGLGDSAGRDSQNIAEMVKHLKNTDHINAFLLVINSQVPRLDEYMRANLQIFSDVFGPMFFKHVILVFTRWGYDSRSMRDRQRTGLTKEKKGEEVNLFLKETYKLTSDLPSIFLDNFPDYNNPTEKKETLEQLKMLKSLAGVMPDFKCLDAQARQGHLDQLRAEEEAERRRKERAEAEAKDKAALVLKEKERREREAKILADQIEQERLRLEKEQEQKEIERRQTAKQIFAEKISRGLLNRFNDWCIVSCPGGEVPTTRPDLILCGPGNKVTIEPGGNLSPIHPETGKSLSLQIYQLVAGENGVIIRDFSKLKFFPEG